MSNYDSLETTDTTTMTARPLLPPLKMALRMLRSALRWTQTDLAEAVGAKSAVLEIETRGQRFSREEFDAFTAAMGVDPEIAEGAVALAEALHAEPRETERQLPVEVRLEIERRVRDRAKRYRQELFEAARTKWIARERARAEETWLRFAELDNATRCRALATAAECDPCRSWAFVERVCEESARMAPRSTETSVELAKLAVNAAELVANSERVRKESLAYARAFLGNAIRVTGDLPLADSEFSEAYRILGTAAVDTLVPVSPLDLVRMLGLEASLRRAQRRLDSALELLERALAKPCADMGSFSSYMLIKGMILDLLGRPAEAAETFEQAMPLVDAGTRVRPQFAARFNLAANWIELGRLEEAEALLPTLRRLASSLANETDVWRIEWLQARLAAARGNRDLAVSKLEGVISNFACASLGYDQALATLELAGLLLEKGANRQARERVATVVPLFRSVGVVAEGAASVFLFLKALEGEVATAQQARLAAATMRRIGSV